MSLRIALCLSILLHAVAVQVPLPGDVGVQPEVSPGRDRLDLRLVDPVSTLGSEVIADGAAAPAVGAATGAGGPGERSGGASAAERESLPPAIDGRTAEPTSAAPAAEPAATESVETAATSDPSATRAPRPAGRGPTLAELEEELGLDLSDVVDQGRDQIFPVMLKVHLNGGRPSASTYRQLLRTYIDVLMGYPWAIQGDLARNADVQFLALLQVEVLGDGRFRIASMLINENVDDEEGRIEGFYRRLLDEVATRPFLPPTRAGLEAPAMLTFQILNPEATR